MFKWNSDNWICASLKSQQQLFVEKNFSVVLSHKTVFIIVGIVHVYPKSNNYSPISHNREENYMLIYLLVVLPISSVPGLCFSPNTVFNIALNIGSLHSLETLKH